LTPNRVVIVFPAGSGCLSTATFTRSILLAYLCKFSTAAQARCDGARPVPHLESETRTSPARPLCGPRRRIVARSLSLGFIALALLSSHPGAPKGFSP
jgi:hypothetical protein